MNRRTVLKASAITAGVCVIPAAVKASQVKEWPWAEGQWAMVKLDDEWFPSVCSTVDGGCVNVTLRDGTVCPAHTPLSGIFRKPDNNEMGRYWRHMAEREAVTVWADGSFRLWHRQDALFAENDPDWQATIGSYWFAGALPLDIMIP